MRDPVRRALLVLAICSFGLGTGEYVVVGLLPGMASDLGVSVPAVGHLVSAYALGVVIGAPLLAAASVRFPRKGLLISLVVALALGNLASAAMPDYNTLLGMRFLSGLPHGAFFGLASVQAANMVSAGRRSQAMAVVFAGLTIANVIGVPLTTYIGQQASWRTVFVLIAGVELIGVLGVLAAVPRSPRSERQRLREELGAFRNRQIWLSLAVAVIGCGGIHATFSYIAPMMTEVAGYRQSDITPLLVLFGLGMTFGNLIGAQLADRYNGAQVIYGVMAAQVVVAAAFYFAASDRIASAVLIFLFPFCNTMAFPALQNRIISQAGGAPNLAAAGMHAAFNIANSLGAWLGGITIASGLGYNSPNLVAVGLGVLALLIALYAARTQYSLTTVLPLPTSVPGGNPMRPPGSGPATAPIRIPVVGLNTNPIPIVGRYSNSDATAGIPLGPATSPTPVVRLPWETGPVEVPLHSATRHTSSTPMVPGPSWPTGPMPAAGHTDRPGAHTRRPAGPTPTVTRDTGSLPAAPGARRPPPTGPTPLATPTGTPADVSTPTSQRPLRESGPVPALTLDAISAAISAADSPSTGITTAPRTATPTPPAPAAPVAPALPVPAVTLDAISAVLSAATSSPEPAPSTAQPHPTDQTQPTHPVTDPRPAGPVHPADRTQPNPPVQPTTAAGQSSPVGVSPVADPQPPDTAHATTAPPSQPAPPHVGTQATDTSPGHPAKPYAGTHASVTSASHPTEPRTGSQATTASSSHETPENPAGWATPEDLARILRRSQE
ncbi:MFS transporter [Kineosporia succinea]|uniref:MFS family arabinose efflux permease n=1 Tax=Kineosporia succinea TaxID=84632 RepID=A0ABT9P1V5_9ACTN|nr:MFS transporter [Kineosporia succinea]MDP9826648.1 putative MFS family arabinose efflux permease [Kineosporia succinea]